MIYLVNEALESVKSPYASFIPTATLKDVKKQLEEIRKILGADKPCKYVCKYCGCVIEEDPEYPNGWFESEGEEELWGHIQMNHEDIFEECQDWDTPTMLEECYEIQR